MAKVDCDTMKIFRFAMGLFLLGALLARGEEAKPSDDAPVVRATRLTTDGTSLFSWHEKGSGQWRFALLPAPNVEKLKAPAEVATPENTIEGVLALKKKISALAINEKVGWYNMLEKRGPAPENLIFEFPSKDTIKDLELYCTVLKVRLNIYVPAGKK